MGLAVIQKGYFSRWPGISVTILLNNFPSDETQKEYMKKWCQHVKLTKKGAEEEEEELTVYDAANLAVPPSEVNTKMYK